MRKIRYLLFTLMLVICLSLFNNMISAKIYKSYKVGDKVTYKDMDFYVIANSDENSDYVTLLKAEPLTVDEVNKYGSGHVNRYTSSSVGTAVNHNGYGIIVYYSSSTCGYLSSWSYVATGCTTDYAKSDIKYAVDAWVKDKIKTSNLKADNLGYKARLITYDELTSNLGYEKLENTSLHVPTQGSTPEWVYNSNYAYWTMSPTGDSSSNVWTVNSGGNLNEGQSVDGDYNAVRPVINLKKNTIGGVIDTGDLEKIEYNIGDVIKYKGIKFYVISSEDDYLTLLKATPLTVDEVNKYGKGYVNKQTKYSVDEAYNPNNYGYGGVAYYSGNDCHSNNYTDCKSSYGESDIKHIVDGWTAGKLNDSDLQEILIEGSKYKSRLITKDELENDAWNPINSAPFWVRNYHYWTMSSTSQSSVIVAPTFYRYSTYQFSDYSYEGAKLGPYAITVRPVIHLKKSATFDKVTNSKKTINDTEFKIGDIVEYNGLDYYVIKDASKTDGTLTMVKKEPLTVDEVNTYGVGHINRYTYSSVGTAYDNNGYGAMAYYTSKTCGYAVPGNDKSRVYTGCTNDYAKSDVKYVVDAWAAKNLNESELQKDSLGYKVRLLTIGELNQNLGYVGRGPVNINKITSTEYYQASEDTKVNLQDCWTMSVIEDSDGWLYSIGSNGNIGGAYLSSMYGVCPVITVSKATESGINGGNLTVLVPDTLLKNPIFYLVLGIGLVIIAIIIVTVMRRAKRR